MPSPTPPGDGAPPPPSLGTSSPAHQREATRFPVAVDATLRAAGWEPGRWDIRQTEHWADALRAHSSPGGHRHAVFAGAVEAWAEFGGLTVTPSAPGRQLAPVTFTLDPLRGLHLARTLGDLGHALGTEMAPLGGEDDSGAVLTIDGEGRVYSLDHSGDWFLGATLDQALATLILGNQPTRLTVSLP
ncbi:SUKH-3 domain-containing protein [Streptomyces sp. NPDC059740]|uniref:SUKH-3 domain-containing protein n=1 Tax=Streptomyces sp. NPDC059740 TaxID=3346926 RepID=UPI00365EAB56